MLNYIETEIEVLVCDDDPINLGINQKCLEMFGEKYGNNLLIHTFTEYNKNLSDYISSNKVDFAVLDIELGKENGLQIAQLLYEKNPHLPIIFITGYKKYESVAWEIMATGYLKKPVNPEKFELLYLRAVSIAKELKRNTDENYIDFHANRRIIKLKVSNIISVEKILRKTIIKTIDGDSYETNESIKRIESLIGPGFVKVNQGVLVSRREVKAIDKNNVYLSNGDEFFIGITYALTVQNVFKCHK